MRTYVMIVADFSWRAHANRVLAAYQQLARAEREEP